MNTKEVLDSTAARDLSVLIERLSSATGPDRELDEHIARVVLDSRGVCRLADMPPTEPSIKVYRQADGSVGTALRYTASLDAAQTLVPEGYFQTFGHNPNEDDDTASDFGASLRRYWHVSDAEDAEAVAATLPLAVVIAALKARAVLEGSTP